MGLLPLLLACGDAADTGAAPADSDPADTDTAADADTSGDDDPCHDTGLAQLHWAGSFTTDAGAYVEASFGWAVYGPSLDAWVCTILGTLPDEGPAPPGCPSCDWSFDLGPVEASVASGDYCDDMGVTDGRIDGYWDYAWGFAEVYYYDYAGTPLPLEDALFLYVDDAWFTFAFNYGGRTWAEGDAEHLEVVREVPRTYGYGYGGDYWWDYDRCP